MTIKYIYFIAILQLLIASSCTKIADLQPNEFHDDSIVFIEFTDYEIDGLQYSPTKNVIVNFTTIYNELTELQQNNIAFLSMNSPNRNLTLEPDATTFIALFEPAGVNICYKLEFVSVGGHSSKPAEICIDI